MSNDLVRLQPPVKERSIIDDDDFDTYLLTRRQCLAEELREVEKILLKRGRITRLLCMPTRRRD